MSMSNKQIIRYNATSTNFFSVELTSTNTIYVSYNTIVAYRNEKGLQILKNSWGTATGKHLNYLSTDKKSRLDTLTVSGQDMAEIATTSYNSINLITE